MAFDLITANNKLYRINRENGESWTYDSYNNKWVRVNETGSTSNESAGTETN